MVRDIENEDSGMTFNKGEYAIEQETDKAILVTLTNKDCDFTEWLPKSQAKILYPEEKLFIPEWLWDKYN